MALKMNKLIRNVCGFHAWIKICGFLFVFISNIYAKDIPPLKLVQAISMPGVDGRIDHLSVDMKDQRLFIAAFGNNSLEVIDLRLGKSIHRIAKLRHPQGVYFIPGSNKIYVTNAKNGECDVFDGKTFGFKNKIKLYYDADAVRYDKTTRSILIGFDNALAFVDRISNKIFGRVRLAGHPESFQLDDQGSRIFINIPTANHIAVVNRKKHRVIATWSVAGHKGNFPMALDQIHHRLFVGFRDPPSLVVFDIDKVRVVDKLESPGDCDDIFYDTANKIVYMSCGEGFIYAVKQDDSNHYRMITKIPTVSGARTSLYVPEWHRFYLAVPAHNGQSAQIRVYEGQ